MAVDKMRTMTKHQLHKITILIRAFRRMIKKGSTYRTEVGWTRQELKIEIKKFKDVNRGPYNPRVELKAGMPEYEKIQTAIEMFGYVLPMVHNSRSGNLVAGNQTMTVLEDLGKTEAEMSIVDLSEVEEKALNIALNKTGGMFDNEELSDLLNELIEIPEGNSVTAHDD